MPKISAYADGGAPQGTDQFIVARAGANNSILYSAIIAELDDTYVKNSGNETITGPIEIDCNSATAFVVGDSGGLGDIFEVDTATPEITAWATVNVSYAGTNLVLDQLTNDDDILQLASTGDVAHGITDFTPTNVFGKLNKANATQGGILMSGWSSGQYALYYLAVATTVDTTKTTSSVAPMFLRSRLKSGTSYTSVSSDGNLFAIQNANTTRIIFDAEGTYHLITGDNDVDIIALSATTGTPTLSWDESEDAFSQNKGLRLTSGDIELAFGADTTRMILIGNDFDSGDTAIFRIGDANYQIETTFGAAMKYRAYHGHTFYNFTGNEVSKFGTSAASLNSYFLGRLGVGLSGTPSGQLHVDQSSATGAIPVLYLDQADVSEPYITYAPGSDIDVILASVAVTGTPTLLWDESESAFSSNVDLVISKDDPTLYLRDTAGGTTLNVKWYLNSGQLYLYDEDNTRNIYYYSAAANTTTWESVLDAKGASGGNIYISSADADIVTNDVLGTLHFFSRDGSADSLGSMGKIFQIAVGTFAGGNHASDMVFQVMPLTGTTLNEVFRLGYEGGVYITEVSGAGTDIAGKGQLWVKNTTPCELWFTDDAGTDTQIA